MPLWLFFIIPLEDWHRIRPPNLVVSSLSRKSSSLAPNAADFQLAFQARCNSPDDPTDSLLITRDNLGCCLTQGRMKREMHQSDGVMKSGTHAAISNSFATLDWWASGGCLCSLNCRVWRKVSCLRHYQIGKTWDESNKCIQRRVQLQTHKRSVKNRGWLKEDD